MRKPSTDRLLVSCPSEQKAKVIQFLLEAGCQVVQSIPADEVFPDQSGGKMLLGARYREGLTQEQLAKKAGIPRRHISEMENGKRPIGKHNAAKLGVALGVNPRYLIT